jgi:D-3-phosphoglycerate dehydrogenase / 2-oxoglutarate reductase
MRSVCDVPRRDGLLSSAFRPRVGYARGGTASDMTILIAESEGFSPAALRQLRSRADVVEADLGREELLAAVSSADVLWVRLRNQIDGPILDAAQRLRVIVTNTTGLNHIDLEAAHRRGIRVLSLKGEVDLLKTVRATAELTLGLMLSLVRRLPAAAAHVQQGGWDRYAFKGHDLYEKTAGIVGLGRLGRIVAGYLQALGMRVVATSREEEAAEGVSLLPLEELLPLVDLVSVHVDLNPDTRGMFGDRQFAAMKDDAWFVNTARGEVVDERALLHALESGTLGGAALDVLAGEPLSVTPSHPLVRYAATHDNLIVTPHIGGYTFESLARTELHLAGTLVRFLDTLQPAQPEA